MEIETDTTFETKAGIPADAAVTHAEMMRAFEAFKEANDRGFEKRSADVLLEEKLARIDSVIAAQTQRLDAIALKPARPALGSERGDGACQSARIEHKAAFDAYVRGGESAGLRALEVKAMSVGSNPDGGYPGAGRDRDTRSASGSRRSRRSARSPACARSAATSTRSRS